MSQRWRRYFEGKRVWLTGASSGIGHSLACLLGEAGVDLLISARRGAALDDLASRFPTVRTLSFDMAQRDTLAEAATRAWDTMGRIDVLINNAGVSQRARFAETDPSVLEHIYAVNFLGPARLTREVVGRMIQQGNGHLVTISSYVVSLPAPTRTAYSASKAALHGLFDALRPELLPSGIDVTLVKPGFIRTEISQSAMTGSGSAHGVLDATHARGLSPDQCARRILAGVARRRAEFSIGLSPMLILGGTMHALTPRLLDRVLSKMQMP